MNTQSTEKPPQKKQSPEPQPSIAERAYEFYVQRGKEPGHELDDWLKAEREVREAQRRH